MQRNFPMESFILNLNKYLFLIINEKIKWTIERDKKSEKMPGIYIF